MGLEGSGFKIDGSRTVEVIEEFRSLVSAKFGRRSIQVLFIFTQK